MTAVELASLAMAALFTSALTALTGIGGGIILLGVVLLFMPPATAIPFHGLVQLVANGWRVVLFRNDISWPLAWRFSALLPAGVVLGLWAFQGLSPSLIQLLIGLVVLLALFSRRLAILRGRDLPLAAFWPLGFLVGALNMMVGVVGPLLGVLVVRRELNRMQVIGTLGYFALVGHVFKVLAFGATGFDYGRYLPAFAAMLPAVLLGGLLGRWLLGLVEEAAFRLLFQLLLAALAIHLIVWKGILGLLAT